MSIPSRHTLHGTPVVEGVAYAKAAWTHRAPEPSLDGPELPEDQRESEVARFITSADKVAELLEGRAAATVGTPSDILAVSAGFARDKGLRREVTKNINSGVQAVPAIARATATFVEIFQAQGGPLAERVTDLKDIRDRIVADLEGRPQPGVPQPDSPVILLAEDLAPADTAGLDPDLILGIATILGGPTSHTSIISRQLGIPCLVAARDLGQVHEGDQIFLDGGLGEISLDPDPEAAATAVELYEKRREAIRAWRGPAATADGHSVELLANVRDGAGAHRAAESQAAGIGLFRTELSFLNAQSEPSIDQQAAVYGAVFDAFPGAKVVVRTLDAGSDKPVAWASVLEEENPALGVRGLRTSGIDQGLLVRQLDSIARTAYDHGGRDGFTHSVMAPMVSTIPEARWFAQLVRERNLSPGIMIEVPSAAILADQFLAEVDFVSIGTNDLTQYVMAADRMSPNLATYTDTWQPAVLALIAHVAAAGKRTGKPVSVCGEAAADPLLACVLIGMGVTSLSMAPAAIATVGSMLATVTMEQCQKAAAAIKGSADSGETHRRAREILTPEG